MRFADGVQKHDHASACIRRAGEAEANATMDTALDNTPNYARWVSAGAAVVFARGALWGAAEQMVA